MNISLQQLEDYNHDLEMAREAQYKTLVSSTDKAAQRNAVERLASLTALRSDSFVCAHERALGLRNE
jgi:hypothetical protein